MTMRAYINRWWLSDPNVTPCPTCGCPLQAPPRRSMATSMKAHYETVHPDLAMPMIVNGGAS